MPSRPLHADLEPGRPVKRVRRAGLIVMLAIGAGTLIAFSPDAWYLPVAGLVGLLRSATLRLALVVVFGVLVLGPPQLNPARPPRFSSTSQRAGRGWRSREQPTCVWISAAGMHAMTECP